MKKILLQCATYFKAQEVLLNVASIYGRVSRTELFQVIKGTIPNKEIRKIHLKCH